MINIIKFFLVLWISVTCAGIVFGADECLTASEPGYTIPRHLEYAFTLQNTTNHVIKEADLWTYAPVTRTATQQRIQVDASHPFEELADDAGNTILHFTVYNLPPFATKIITIQTDVLLSDTPLPIAPRSATPSLQRSAEESLQRSAEESLQRSAEESLPSLHPEPYCESDDPDIIQFAQQLMADDSLSTAKNIFRWVTDNIEFSGYLKNPRGARYALEHKQGDCTELMYLFVALCRAAGIPARGVGGYVYAKNAILKPADYHNWAEFYVDGVWHVADPQRSIFKQNQSHYLVMRVIGAVSDDHPMGHYMRFRYLGEELKARMN